MLSRKFFVFVSIIIAWSALIAGPLHAGPDIRVNTFTAGAQNFADVAINAAGSYVVVWGSDPQDGDNNGVFGRRFDSAGAPQATEFQISVYTSGSQRVPAVSMRSDGGFVVAWEDSFSGYSYVYARRFDSAGGAVGSQFRASFFSGDQGAADVGVAPDGSFVVVWHSYFEDGDALGVFGQRFNSSGTAAGQAFRANDTYQDGNQQDPKVSVAASGFIVSWLTPGHGGSNQDLHARRYEASGVAIAQEFKINSATSINVSGGAVAIVEPSAAVGVVSRSGPSAPAFLATWTSLEDKRAHARYFDSLGAPSADFVVSRTGPAYDYYTRDVDIAGVGGRFVVAWSTTGYQYARNIGVATGVTTLGGVLSLDQQLDIGVDQSGDQIRPAVALRGDGDALIVYDGPPQAPGVARIVPRGGPQEIDVFLRNLPAESPTPTLSPTATGTPTSTPIVSNTPTATPTATPTGTSTGGAVLDVDLDGEVQALTDGLLILRWRFGFTGATLINGAFDAVHCQRCDAPAIEGYLASIASQLDIDGDGELEALTDGLLILRWLFGFTGATLINGAVDTQHCTRCTSGDIGSQLGGLDG